MDSQAIFDQIVKQRGIKSVDAFLNPDYDKHLHDPRLLPDLDKVIARLKTALSRKEKVVIYGDYDIDGLTATTLLSEALTKFGFIVDSFIPDRFTEGYGMSKIGVDEINSRGGTLIITVDCGSRSLEEIKYAKSLGIDVIVTDHHELGDELPPEAIAVINPKREDSKYPFRDLAGCGVAFKLVQAMQSEFKGMPAGTEKWLLDLVAFGTVCDVVDLLDENRTLVKWGLEVMKKTRRPGLQALAKVSSTTLSEISTSDLGFRFGPRLNAAGRLEHAKSALDLLQASKAADALYMADQLNILNYARRSDQDDIYKAARAEAEQSDDDVLVLASEDWSHGINGIVAARLSEEFAKPAFVLQIIEDEIKGSARSFGDFHLADAIDASKKHIVTGGGHAAAAGVTLEAKQLEAFRQAMNKHYKSLKLSNQTEHLIPDIDVEVELLEALDLELIEMLDSLAPFGHAHEAPVFSIEPAAFDWKAVGSDKSHAKITLSDKDGHSIGGIAFGKARALEEKTPTKVLFRLERNEWNGRVSPQAQIAYFIF